MTPRLPLLIGDEHNLLSGRTVGDPHPQYVSKQLLQALAPRISVLAFGAQPGIDASAAFNAAHAALPATGGTIYVPWADQPWLLSSEWLITKSNVQIEIESGAIIRKTNNTGRGTIHVDGTEDAASAKNLIANVSANQVELRVASGDEAGFAPDDWIYIQDTKVPGVAVPAECVHGEINRVKAVVGGSPATIKLYYPTHDSYTTALTVNVRKIAPVENFSLIGGGIVENDNTPSGGTSTHGLFMYYAVNPRIEGPTFRRCHNSGVHGARCQGIYLAGGCIKDPPRFDSRGYGFTCYSCWDIVVANMQIQRTRHAVDISVFSGKAAVVANKVFGSTTGGINTHPNVQHVLIANNIIDGCYGQNDIGGGVADDWGIAVQASGINVDELSSHISVIGNIVRGTRLSGIFVDTFGTTHVLIADNNISLFNLGDTTTHAGIHAQEQFGGGTDLAGYVIENNKIHDGSRYGMQVGINGMKVSGNQVWAIDNGGGIGIGIWVWPSTNTNNVNGGVVENNSCWDNAQDGIRIGKDATTTIVKNLVVQGNTCYDNGTHGIFLEETTSDCTVEANHCFGNSKASPNVSSGISNQGDRNYLVGNFCFDDPAAASQRHGIAIVSTADGTVLDRNFLKENVTSNFSDAGTNTRILSFLDIVNWRTGVGTAAPGQLLDVAGIAQINQLIVNDAAANVDARMEGTTDANAFYLDADATGGSIGIGTNAPAAKLDVRGATQVRVTATEAFKVQDGSSNNVLTIDTSTPTAAVSGDLTVNGFATIEGANQAGKFAVVNVSANASFSIDTDTFITHINGALHLRFKSVASSPYTVLGDDYYLSVSTAAARTINLPAIAGTNQGREIVIKDGFGTGALVNNITIARNGSDTIDQVAGNITLNVTRQSITLMSDGTSNWEIVSRYL